MDRYDDGGGADLTFNAGCPALHIALYERPYDKDPAEEARWLAAMAHAAAERLAVDIRRVFIKTRRRMKGLEQYERAAHEGFTMIVREAGLRFHVNLSDYLDTGLFLDHRPARSLVRAQAKGKRVLNLFCYTGAFSVYAASGGAAQVSSVDLSNTYLAWAEKNFSLNGFVVGAGGRTDSKGGGVGANGGGSQSFEFIKSDAVSFLDKARRAGQRWDIIVADPPTFSNSSMTERDFDLQRDWPALLSKCAAVLAPKGSILFSTNARKLQWDETRSPLPARDISQETIPPDFRDRRIHRSWLLQ